MRIAIFVGGWPRLTETFIAQEIFGLENAGLNIALFSVTKPKNKKTHPIHRQIKAKVTYLNGTFLILFLKALPAIWHFRKNQNLFLLLKLFRDDLKRQFSLSLFKRLFQAFIFSYKYANHFDYFYVHFLHKPATVVHYAHILTQKPWGFSAHAKDIYTSQKEDLKNKLKTASWGNTCTAYNKDFFNMLDPEFNIHLLYHGIDLGQFNHRREFDLTQNAGNSKNPIQLLTIARAIDKKGLDIILHALASLPSHIHWHWHHIGEGKDINKYTSLAKRLNLSNKVKFLGALSQDQILPYFKEADLFLLPCRISKSGDRDGLPNVLVEACAMAIPCLSANISGVKELITHLETGYLIEENDLEGFKKGLLTLIENPDLRQKLALAAQEKVINNFGYQKTITQIVQIFNDNKPEHLALL